MEKGDWERARVINKIVYEKVKKYIPKYAYNDLETAAHTDDLVCEYFLKKLREAKKKAFHLVETSYELHRADLTPAFDNLRLDIDIFSDELKMKFADFRKITVEFMGDLMKHDLEIIESLESFLFHLDDMNDKLIASSKPLNVKELRSELADIVILFKERELITNLKHTSLRRTFNRMRVELNEKIGID